MNDPYKILGLNPHATDDEVREAYRKLSMQYHPDLHLSSPLSDVAEEKMKDLNVAFDEIMNMRRGGVGVSNTAGSATSEAYNQSAGFSGGSYQERGDDVFNEVRRMIQKGQSTAADNLLERPDMPRNAEWNFLKGTVCYGRAWLNEAYKYLSTAVSMDPSNVEYSAALQQMNRARQGQMNGNPNPGPYRQNGAPMMGCSVCDMCQGLICADCCCECMGGNLIPCC